MGQSRCLSSCRYRQVVLHPCSGRTRRNLRYNWPLGPTDFPRFTPPTVSSADSNPAMSHIFDPKHDEIRLEHRASGENVDRDTQSCKDPNFDLEDMNCMSADSDLSFWQTLRLYWKAMLICFGAGICAMGDGYQFKMPGNIVALRGFIDQMGHPDATGTYVLNPQHVAAWGGKTTICKRPCDLADFAQVPTSELRCSFSWSVAGPSINLAVDRCCISPKF